MHPTHPAKMLRAYGDRQGDGMVQMIVRASRCRPPRAPASAAKKFAELHGLRRAARLDDGDVRRGYT